MRRVIGVAFIIIAATTLIIWVISQFIQPILPPNLNNTGILLFAALLSTIGAIAGFKDIIELINIFKDTFGKEDVGIQHNLPQPNYQRFIGREEEIEKIQELLLPNSRHFVITIDGVGGVGKTALALEVAYSYLRKHSTLRKPEKFQALIWTTAKKDVLTGEGIVPQHQTLHTLNDIYLAISAPLKRHDIFKFAFRKVKRR